MLFEILNVLPDDLKTKCRDALVEKLTQTADDVGLSLNNFMLHFFIQITCMDVKSRVLWVELMRVGREMVYPHVKSLK